VAAARDLDELAALARLLFSEHADHARFGLRPGCEAGLVRLLAGWLSDPARDLRVAEAPDGGLAGFVASSLARRPGLFVETERGAIDWLFVREESRRAGTGRALAAAALAWLRARGVARVEVQVARANAGGRSFWRAHGFAASMDVLDLHL
jgi:GNAT superfamily N-acetyltransferase